MTNSAHGYHDNSKTVISQFHCCCCFFFSFILWLPCVARLFLFVSLCVCFVVCPCPFHFVVCVCVPMCFLSMCVCVCVHFINWVDLLSDGLSKAPPVDLRLAGSLGPKVVNNLPVLPCSWSAPNSEFYISRMFVGILHEISAWESFISPWCVHWKVIWHW